MLQCHDSVVFAMARFTVLVHWSIVCCCNKSVKDGTKKKQWITLQPSIVWWCMRWNTAMWWCNNELYDDATVHLMKVQQRLVVCATEHCEMVQQRIEWWCSMMVQQCIVWLCKTDHCIIMQQGIVWWGNRDLYDMVQQSTVIKCNNAFYKGAAKNCKLQLMQKSIVMGCNRVYCMVVQQSSEWWCNRWWNKALYDGELEQIVAFATEHCMMVKQSIVGFWNTIPQVVLA